MQFPVNGQTIDYMGLVTGWVDNLVQSHAGLLVPDAFRWLTGLFFVMTFKTVAMWGLFRRGDPFDVAPYVALFVKWAIAYSMLSFYDSPFLGTGVSVHQIFSEEARYIAGLIDLSSVNSFVGAINTALTSLEKPSIYNVLGAWVYGGTELVCMILYFLAFGVTAVGYCMYALGALLGPLFIVWLIVPSGEWLFSAWIRFMLIYSFWRVGASAFIFIWSNVMLDFFVRVVGRDYSLGHFIWVLPIMGGLTMAFAYTLFKLSDAMSNLFHGTATLSSPIGSVAQFAGSLVK